MQSEAAVKAGAPHFIFSSTAATYGVLEVKAVSEDTLRRPINPYAWSKLMTEQMLGDTAAANPINFCALRYFNVTGADPKARSGQSTAGATHLIKVAVEAALGKQDGVSVYGTDYDTPNGTGVRDYIHVSDLTAAHVLALEALMDAPERSLTMNRGYGPEVLGARNARCGGPSDQPDDRAPYGAAPCRRSGLADIRPSAHSQHAAVGTATRRSRCDYPARAGLGAQTLGFSGRHQVKRPGLPEHPLFLRQFRRFAQCSWAPIKTDGVRQSRLRS